MAFADPTRDCRIQALKSCRVEMIEHSEQIQIGMLFVKFAACGGTVEDEGSQIVPGRGLELVDEIR